MIIRISFGYLRLQMENSEPIDEQLLKLNRQLSLVEKEELRNRLAMYVNHLLLQDFNRLVSLLYRVDVNEKKLKDLLQQYPGTDAALIIADLLIRRQEEKIEIRKQFRPGSDHPGEEK